MESSIKVTIPSQVLARGAGDQTVILDLVSGTRFDLDAVGARIWHLMNEGKTIGEVCDAIEADVQTLVRDLAACGLVNPV